MFPIRNENKSEHFPIVTVLLISLNVIIYLYQRKFWNLESFHNKLALIPYNISHLKEFKFYFTLVTYMFIHGGLLHLFSNMLYLWIFGDNVEDRLGHIRFLYFYLLCGIGAGLVHVIMYPSSVIPTIGASGAISGVLASYMLMFPNAKIVTLIPIFIFFEVIRIPAFIFIILWFLLQSIYGISSLSQASNIVGVAWFAHIGGFVIGVMLLPLFLLGRKKNFF
jgi:membrane associated rhomboid family serine protease